MFQNFSAIFLSFSYNRIKISKPEFVLGGEQHNFVVLCTDLRTTVENRHFFYLFNRTWKIGTRSWIVLYKL